MISVGFFNNKGGVGKTTLICNLAATLAIKHQKKVLVLDADPQCNASAYLLKDAELERIFLEDNSYTIDKFFDPVRKGQGYSTDSPEILRSQRFKVDLIVGSPRLSLREDLLATDWAETKNGEYRGFQTTYALKELISRQSNYDYVLVDMGPSLGALNRSVMLAVDYFLMPLSVDIFSLMAVDNILRSFETWKNDLTDATRRYEAKEGGRYQVSGMDAHWNLRFAGYVMQQYTAKSKAGIRQAVGAYERIIERQQAELRDICSFFNSDSATAQLGEVPTLHSVVPLSQQKHAPIFELGSTDGIVGTHYNKVREAGEFFQHIAINFLSRVKS